MNPLALLDNPRAFALSQKVNPMTVGLYRELVVEHVRVGREGAVLDIGCGTGAHRPLLRTPHYVGIDLNPMYVEFARSVHGDLFRVMDARTLDFGDGTFDAVFTVATCHHLDDARVVSMVAEALRVLRPGGALHVIDPVWPVSRRAVFKRALFARDRGRFQRTVAGLTSLLASRARLVRTDVRSGAIHDVCYAGLTAL